MARARGRSRPRPPADLVVNATLLAVVLPFVARSGRLATARTMATFAACAAVERVAVVAVRRRAASPPGPADPLTFGRAASGTLLLALVAAGSERQTGPLARLAFGAAVAGCTVADWLDGPLARRAGSTAAGAVFDIEADSWLTFGAAIAAVRWGGLPWWTVLPPILRYRDPIAAWRRGAWFASNGDRLGRAAGSAQMALFLAAIAPVECPRLTRALRRVSLLVTAAQLATQVRREA